MGIFYSNLSQNFWYKVKNMAAINNFSFSFRYDNTNQNTEPWKPGQKMNYRYQNFAHEIVSITPLQKHVMVQNWGHIWLM
jgi:hypothetical protein